MPAKGEKEIEFEQQAQNSQIQLDQNIPMGAPILPQADPNIKEKSESEILMQDIVQVYMFQFLLQFGLIMLSYIIFVISRSRGNLYQPSISYLIINLLLIIVLPIAIFKIKSFQQKYIIYGYSVAYVLFISGIPWLPNYFSKDSYQLVYGFVLYVIYVTLMQLILLSGLYALLWKLQSVYFNRIFFIGGIEAIIIFLISLQHKNVALSIFLPITIIAYMFYFIFALKVVVYGQKFNLTKDQGAFGAVAVYCVIMAPCIAAIEIPK